VQGRGPFTLNVTGQGCADKGLCYPPQDASVRLVAGGARMAPGQGSRAADERGPARQAPGSARARRRRGAGVHAAGPVQRRRAAIRGPAVRCIRGSRTGEPAVPRRIPRRPAGRAATAASAPSELSGIAALLQGGRLLAIVPAFILLGLGLAFTPCVLPMVPILSSIIVGEGKDGRARGFVLSLSYSLGMAIVYTLLGVAAGLLGEGLAAACRTPGCWAPSPC
jgi:thiol:disulfide interchange protein DsbD